VEIQEHRHRHRRKTEENRAIPGTRARVEMKILSDLQQIQHRILENLQGTVEVQVDLVLAGKELQEGIQEATLEEEEEEMTVPAATSQIQMQGDLVDARHNLDKWW
jgi:hypothetical protein